MIDLNQQGRDATEDEMMKMKDREAKEQNAEGSQARDKSSNARPREDELVPSREAGEDRESAIRASAGQHSGFMGAAQFSQSIQTGALNNDAAFHARAELDKLDKIAEIMKEFKDDVAREQGTGVIRKVIT